MKKEKVYFIIVLSLALLVFAVFCLISSHNASAQINTANPTDILGINPETIPKTPEEATSLAGTYLQKQWENILNNTAAGKVHNYLLQHQLPFNILLNENYELSSFFFWVLVLWLFIWAIFNDIFISAKLDAMLSIFLGLVAAVGLARIGLIRVTANGLIALITKPEYWWAKILIAIVILAALVFIKIYFKLIKQFFISMWKSIWLRETREIAETAEMEAEEAMDLPV